MCPSLSALVLIGRLSPYDSESNVASLFGGKPLPVKKASSKCGSTRSTPNEPSPSFPIIGSGTMTMAARCSPDTTAIRYGSPLVGLNAKSMGSSFAAASPHWSGVRPAQISVPSFPMLAPSMMVEGFPCTTGQLITEYSLSAGRPEKSRLYLTSPPCLSASFARIDTPSLDSFDRHAMCPFTRALLISAALASTSDCPKIRVGNANRNARPRSETKVLFIEGTPFYTGRYNKSSDQYPTRRVWEESIDEIRRYHSEPRSMSDMGMLQQQELPQG